MTPTSSGPLHHHRHRAQRLVMQMMAIPGPPGQEKAVGQFIERQLYKAGLPANAIRRDQAHRKSPLGGQVGNLIVTLPGTLNAPRRLLMAHMDTVPLCVGSKPTQRGRRVVSSTGSTGLGADNRSGSAALLVALLEILDRGLPHPPLTFLWTVQEEVGLNGARHVDLALLKRPALAFNFDGGVPEELVIGATGAYRMTIEVQGLAAHAGGHPERGVSATAIVGLAVADLVKGGWHGLIHKGGLRGTSNVGVIQAGQATNVVTDQALVRAEARAHDPILRRSIVRAYRRAFAKAALQVRNRSGGHGRARFKVIKSYEAYGLKRQTPCVAQAAAVIQSLGLKPLYRISNGGLDANWLVARSIPTVTLGAGQKDIHTVKESLDLEQFHRACRIALLLATNTQA